jgi:nicotinamide-nucleotide amidase
VAQRCDVLAVGTELLLGQIIDSNSAWIGGELAANGIDSLLQVKVGDNVGRIEAQLRRLLESADAVIMCGGLGPTHDDLTRDAIAAVMGVELVLDDAVADVIRGCSPRGDAGCRRTTCVRRWCPSVRRSFHRHVARLPV